MTEPTKVIAFRKLDPPIGLRASKFDATAFPRFRREWDPRPNPPPLPKLDGQPAPAR